MSNIPDRINVEKGERDNLYDKIELFKGKSRKEQFLFAMAIGFKNKVKRRLETTDGFFLIKDMRLEDEVLINAIAINDFNSVEVLSNKEDVFKIAEEYAHAGIKLLYDKMKSTQFGSFEKQFEKDIIDAYKELNLGEYGEKNTSS
ncbi:Uncharacterised protein [uncultured archaeon]|nr:Uncharacterised protein [uncultured archaeon]